MKEILFVILINTGHGLEVGGALNQEFPTRVDCLTAKYEFLREMKGNYDQIRIWCQPIKFQSGNK